MLAKYLNTWKKISKAFFMILLNSSYNKSIYNARHLPSSRVHLIRPHKSLNHHGNESLSNTAVFIQKLSVNAYAADSPSGQYFIATL